MAKTSAPAGDPEDRREVEAEIVKEDELDILRGNGIDSAQTPTELIKSGMALVKLENTTQMTIARATPRNEERVLKKCLAELALYPDMAAEAVYVKPVGKDRNGVMQYVEGLSIRAAESLATRWGNCAYGAEPIADDGEIFTLGVVFLDYESNVRASRLLRISRKFKRRTGQISTYSEDRFNSTVIPAAQSKALREVILRALPSGLTKAYLKKAQELMNKQFTPEQQKHYQKKLVESFAQVKVSEEQIGEILGKPLNMGITENELTKLRGIYNALKDGETTIDQLIGSSQDFQPPAQASAEEALKAARAATKEESDKSDDNTESEKKRGRGRPRKEPESKPAEEKQATETPDGPEEAATTPKRQDLTPPKTTKAEEASVKSAEPAAEDPERAALIQAIKDSSASLENKIAIVSEVCGASFSDQALADMAENPELIEETAKLKSVVNILKMMA